MIGLILAGNYTFRSEPPRIFVNKKSPFGDFLFKKIQCRAVALFVILHYISYLSAKADIIRPLCGFLFLPGNDGHQTNGSKILLKNTYIFLQSNQINKKDLSCLKANNYVKKNKYSKN